MWATRRRTARSTASRSSRPGSGNDTIVADGGGCGATVTAIPGDGDDYVVGDGNDWIDWSSSSAGMAIDIPNETAIGQGTDTWDGS